MNILAIDAATIKELAPIDDLIEWMAEALTLTSGDEAVLPLRRSMPLPGNGGAIGIMPGYVGAEIASAGVKLVSLLPAEKRKGSSHLGLYILYDAGGLEVEAIMCAATLTALRTSAVTAVATDTLARRDASSLALLGSGEQAAAHARALMKVRPFTDLRIWSRNSLHAESLARQLRDEAGLNYRICTDAERTVENADVVCTLTGASDPIINGDMISPGAHVNLVGSSHRDAAEADASLLARSKYFVDYVPSAMDQAGELLRAIAEGALEDNHIEAELGEVLLGRKPGRLSDQEITIYKSLGVATQDIVTARKVYERAKAQDRGSLTLI